MLDAAEGFAGDDVVVSEITHEPLYPSTRNRMAEGTESVGSRYGDRRSVNLPAVLLIILVHAILIFGLMQARQHAHRVRESHLEVVNLTPAPPPPPAGENPPPPPSAPRVVAPHPLMHIPVPSAPIATTPEPALVHAPFPVVSPAPASVAPPAPAAATTVQGGNLAAQMVSGKPPRYPIESRRKHEQGTVLLALTLGIDGAVENLTIAQSSGFSRLDAAARDAVRNWRWKPTIRDGQPVKVKGVVEIPFILRVEGA